MKFVNDLPISPVELRQYTKKQHKWHVLIEVKLASAGNIERISGPLLAVIAHISD
jgi:hypothetical protein